MKVAVCLRGAIAKIGGYAFFTQDSLYRAGKYINFEACHNSIKKHIVGANPDCVFDFFIHCWNEDLKESLITLYQPKSYLFENNSLYIEEINRKLREPNEFTGVSQALSIKKSITLCESFQDNHQIKYDLVIIYRPDLILLKDMIMQKYDCQKIYVNGHTPPDPVGDFHFVMNPKAAYQFKHLYDGIELGNPCQHHFWMHNYIEKFMGSEVITDDIIAGFHEEVLRKIYATMIKGKNMPVTNFIKYGITEEEIFQYNYP